MQSHTHTLKVKNIFNRIHNNYSSHSFIDNIMCERLIERLLYTKISPKNILDLGSNNQFNTNKVYDLYPKAHMVACDIAYRSLNQIASNERKINANAEMLPFKNNCFDLVICNSLMHYLYNPENAIKEIKRVLTPNGLLLFTTIGGDSLENLYSRLEELGINSNQAKIKPFAYWGDLMLQANLNDVVIDKTNISVNYKSLSQLIKDLRLSGANAISPYNHITKAQYELINNCHQPITINYQTIYASGWNNSYAQPNKDNLVTIETSAIS